MSDDAPDTTSAPNLQNAEHQATVARVIALAAPLIAAGAVTIVIEYSGSGDEGTIEASYALDDAGEALDTPIPPGVADELEMFAPSGYEWGEGSYGQVRLDLTTGTVVVDHNDYVLTTAESTHVYVQAEAT